MAITLPAEWEKQEKVLLVFPHRFSDWEERLEIIRNSYKEIIQKIFPDRIDLVCENIEEAKEFLQDIETSHVTFVQYKTNDTWIRDFGPITTNQDYCDFTFNGWGGKFDARRDNDFSKTIYSNVKTIDLALEGGAVEVDGEGTFMATKRSIINDNRNAGISQEQIEKIIRENLGIKRFLWLMSGELENDDTDSHIDMLARFVDRETILYVKCDDKSYPYYEDLQNMEEELKNFRTNEGEPYKLISLPLPKFYDGEERTPATYTNYLITNKKVLVPSYGVAEDAAALEIIKKAFLDKETVSVDCSVLITQGGAIHCASINIFVCSQ